MIDYKALIASATKLGDLIFGTPEYELAEKEHEAIFATLVINGDSRAAADCLDLLDSLSDFGYTKDSQEVQYYTWLLKTGGFDKDAEDALDELYDS